MSSINPKRALFVEFAEVAKCLAHAHRLELVEQLAQGERSVEILAAKTGLSIANTSQHLQQMRRAGIISARRDGKFVFYRLVDESVLDLLAALRRIAERNSAEVERVVRTYFNDRDSLEAVSRDELLAQTRAGFVTVLDVRPRDEFDLGHLPGAVNIPLRDLETRLAEIDPSREIQLQHLDLPTTDEPFAAIILATADRQKVEKRTRSKWSRVMRYAAEYKTSAEPLAAFVRRKGGINKCAARFARWLGRGGRN